jgi:hypothetical protein
MTSEKWIPSPGYMTRVYEVRLLVSTPNYCEEHEPDIITEVLNAIECADLNVIDYDATALQLVERTIAKASHPAKKPAK